MKQFKNDVMHWKDYDFTVINDRVENCYKLISNFINSQKKQKKKLTLIEDLYRIILIIY